ncbi:hypothetical protein JZ751_025265 [Albula glossodonta]|uniref:Uncharacterized protein n=1 Tax=Albula glossodonta TaxID=121402 RepID=A0A8T2NML6_9TELE|nr:hypothetical protein JZ751_025265 [Albula glossodonta]
MGGVKGRGDSSGVPVGSKPPFCADERKGVRRASGEGRERGIIPDFYILNTVYRRRTNAASTMARVNDMNQELGALLVKEH